MKLTAEERAEKRAARRRRNEELLEEYRQKKEEKRKRKREAKERKARERKGLTPAQVARQASENGQKVFQFIEVVTETKGNVAPGFGIFITDETGDLRLDKARGAAGKAKLPAIEAIEDEGWALLDIGYVFQMTETHSRDKFLASGQQLAVSGRVLGIYTFRRTGDS